MAEWVVLTLILLGGWLPGWFALRRFRADLDPLEHHFAALSLGLALTGWLAFLLAELGLFTIQLLVALWILLAITLALISKPHLHSSSSSLRSQRPSRLVELALLVLWLPAALWLFLRPHETIMGGADAGVYVSTAAHIAQHGAILVDDPTLAQIDPALFPAILRPIPNAGIAPAYLFPGFNVADAGAGRIIPDFFHFHPTWQAVAFSLATLSGSSHSALHATLLMPGMWALLGSLAVYLTLRQALDWTHSNVLARVAALLVPMLALAALSLNAIQVWFARYPVTETLTQYLLWSGLWALGGWLAQRRPLSLWGLLAGLSLGLVLLTRIDMLFILAIPLLTVAWQLGRREMRRAYLWFYLPLALLSLNSALHGAFISRPYFTRIVGYVQLMGTRFWPLLLGLVIGLLLVAWLLLRHGKKLWEADLRRPFLGLAIVALLFLAAYAWFLRPVYGALPSYTEWYDGQIIVLTDRENLLRLGWYLSPLGVWLGVAGICLLIWRVDRRTVALLGVGLFFSLLYLWRIQANPHQIYAMRRYVPVTVPFFIVGAAYLLYWLLAPSPGWKSTWQVASRVVGLILALTWLGAIAWSARGFVTQVDYRGLSVQLAQLDEQLPANSVLLFDDRSPVSLGDVLGTPLHYVFGLDVYSLRNPQALDDAALVRTIESWQNSGRSVYWIGAPGWLAGHNFSYTSGEITIGGSALEGSFDHKPHRIIQVNWTLNLNRIEPR